MGYYINPPDRSKEEWLKEQGEPVIGPTWPPPDEEMYVCLVDNGAWTAAGICYNEAEFKAFQPTTSDKRPREWFSVSELSLVDVCPELEHEA